MDFILAKMGGRFDSASKGFQEFIELMGELAMNDSISEALRDRMLIVPAEADIAREVAKNVDPDAISRARQSLKTEIAKINAPRFLPLYTALGAVNGFAVDADAAGKRALRLNLLEYLSLAAKKRRIGRQKFDGGRN